MAVMSESRGGGHDGSLAGALQVHRQCSPSPILVSTCAGRILMHNSDVVLTSGTSKIVDPERFQQCSMTGDCTP